MNPQTVYDVLVMLAEYHERRETRYAQLDKASTDPRADILLRHLVELEQQSARVLRAALNSRSKDHSTYLLPGPTISPAELHAADCRCGETTSFDDVLSCALAAVPQLDELLDRIENCTAAASIGELAKRLREFESIKRREISKFTRED